MPARYILRLTFCEKFSSGELGKILPPPRHSGLLAWPARARPVPFCAQGFLCDLLTSPRPFCARVALARVRLVRGDDLVDQRLVVVAREQRVRAGDRRGRLALVVDQLEIHGHAPFFAGRLRPTGGRRCGRRRRRAPQPLTSSRPRSSSTRTTVQRLRRCASRCRTGPPSACPETRGPGPAPCRSSPACCASASCRATRGSS